MANAHEAGCAKKKQQAVRRRSDDLIRTSARTLPETVIGADHG